MRRLATTCAALLALTGAASCGQSAHDRVEDYLNEVGEAQGSATGEVKTAVSIYRQLATGKLKVASGRGRVERAEASIREVLDRLEAIDPPDEAESLHEKLLRVYELNSSMARETTLFVRFAPRADAAVAPLGKATQKMNAGLESGDPALQARALDSFAATAGDAVRAVRRLNPPPVLEATNRRRADQLGDARSLALELSAAIRRQDAATVTNLLNRFIDASSESVTGLDRKSVRAYNQRYRELIDAIRDVNQEQSRVRRRVVED